MKLYAKPKATSEDFNKGNLYEVLERKYSQHPTLHFTLIFKLKLKNKYGIESWYLESDFDVEPDIFSYDSEGRYLEGEN